MTIVAVMLKLSQGVVTVNGDCAEGSLCVRLFWHIKEYLMCCRLMRSAISH